MSLVNEILKTVSDYPGGYRMIYEIIEDLTGNNKDHKETSLRTTLSRMKKNGLLSKEKDVWKITPLGKAILHQKHKTLISFKEKVTITRKKKIIIMFDIPENRRKYRDWLRCELNNLGFELIQKSVWFGPELPKQFIQYLEEIHILKYVRFFKVQENDII